MTGRALVAQADALRIPLRDESVDLCVTSPPYFSLRAYGAGPGEIGSEATPAEFLAALWQVMGEVKRVLKPGGSAFINLGDKYNSSAHHMQGISSTVPSTNPIGVHPNDAARLPVLLAVREKSLLGLPWAFALGCTGMLAALGGPDPGLDLILRAEIIADKPNGLPESVRDRVRRSHEQWFHFTRFPRYYSAIDEIREPPSGYARPNGAVRATPGGQRPRAMADTVNPLGALPGSVWRIPSEPLRLPDWLGVQHYAAFASEWPRRLILGWSPPGVCVACGEGRWPIVDKRADGKNRSGPQARHVVGYEPVNRSDWQEQVSAAILGYACACTPFTDHPGTGESSGPDGRYAAALEDGAYPNTMMGLGHAGLAARPKVGPWREYHLAGWQPPPTRPAVVLDCCGGVGTTAMVARALGRNAYSFDLSMPYSRAANWRIHHSGNAGKAISRTNLERQGTLYGA